MLLQWWLIPNRIVFRCKHHDVYRRQMMTSLKELQFVKAVDHNNIQIPDPNEAERANQDIYDDSKVKTIFSLLVYTRIFQCCKG